MIATDGNLGRDGRHLTVTSKDLDLPEAIRNCLGVRPAIRYYRNGPERFCYRLQWSDRTRHAWLSAIGLTPAKSLTLNRLAIPESYFADFFRGRIDGDGSILTYVDRYNTVKKPTCVYTRLYPSLVSASPQFLHWIRATMHTLTGASGDIKCFHVPRRTDIWRLRYAKRESLALLRWMYHGPDLPSLGRKREIASAFLVRREPPRPRGPGRPVVI